MSKYLVKRLLLLIPTLILVCVLVFVLIRMVPGSAVDMLVYKYTQGGMQVDADAVRTMLGLDQPAITQFFKWIGDVFSGTMGRSLFHSETVWNMIKHNLPPTLELGFLTLILTNLISIPLGLFCAARQDSLADQSIRTLSVILMAVPVFWIGTLVLIYPALWWRYSPPTQYVSFFVDPIENMRMFLVPALLGAFTQAGAQIRSTRTLTLETLRQDYIRTAWAKGVGEKRILSKHAFRNAMIPIITTIGGSVAGLIGGSVILENMFNIPGIGAQVVSALDNRDYPVVQGCVLIFSIFVMLVNLLVDISYKWIDPRVELE